MRAALPGFLDIQIDAKAAANGSWFS